MVFILEKASKQNNIDDDGMKWKWLRFRRRELSANAEYLHFLIHSFMSTKTITRFRN